MSIYKEYSYASRDGVTTIKGYSWCPDNGQIRGCVQIVHGMQEYIGRYRDFIEYLTSKGFLVFGNDMLGHGNSAPNENELGYFCKNDPSTVIVRDAHRLKKMIQDQHPGVPFYILGHSMGSFLTRKYLTIYGTGIRGAIICGTGTAPASVTGIGNFTASLLTLFRGDHHRSKFISNIAFGGYLKRIENPRTPVDWLTKDEAIVDKYLNDPLCTFMFTTNGFKTLFTLLSFVCKKKNLTTIPKELPIYIIAGEEDPVGNYGEGPKAVYEQYKELGIAEVDLKLYPGMRHEILNEIGKEEVWSDVAAWLASR